MYHRGPYGFKVSEGAYFSNPFHRREPASRLTVYNNNSNTSSTSNTSNNNNSTNNNNNNNNNSNSNNNKKKNNQNAPRLRLPSHAPSTNSRPAGCALHLWETKGLGFRVGLKRRSMMEQQPADTSATSCDLVIAYLGPDKRNSRPASRPILDTVWMQAGCLASRMVHRSERTWPLHTIQGVRKEEGRKPQILTSRNKRALKTLNPKPRNQRALKSRIVIRLTEARNESLPVSSTSLKRYGSRLLIPLNQSPPNPYKLHEPCKP